MATGRDRERADERPWYVPRFWPTDQFMQGFWVGALCVIAGVIFREIRARL